MRPLDTACPPEPLGILAIHASAVQLKGGGLIFLGPSGAGKSTTHDLLSACAQPIADDRVYLIPRSNGQWEVIDAGERVLEGPLTEREAQTLQGSPLRAVFRLHQDTVLRLEPLDALHTCRHLTDAFFDLYWHENLSVKGKKHAFARLATVARSVPGYDLHFDLSPQTAKLVTQAGFY
jgi:hypothetical protein